MLNFICVRTHRSGTKGIVVFSLDPIVYELQKANRKSLEFCWMLKNCHEDVKKSLRFAVCKKTPARFFKCEKKHLSLFLFKIRIHVFLNVTKPLKNLKKAAKCRRTYARFFENAWKHLQNFFQFEKVKKFFEVEKRSVRL